MIYNMNNDKFNIRNINSIEFMGNENDIDKIYMKDIFDKYYSISIGINNVQNSLPYNCISNIKKYLITNDNGHIELICGNGKSGLIVHVSEDNKDDYFSVHKIVNILRNTIIFESRYENFTNELHAECNIFNRETHKSVDISNKELSMFFFDGLLQLSDKNKILNFVENDDSQFFSIYFRIYFYEIDSTMTPKIATDKIGFFHTPLRYISRTDNLDQCATGNVQAIIERKNIHNAPWKYYTHNIEDKYIDCIKDTILSWNKYFLALGLGEPFTYAGNIDRNYPLHGEWIITSINIEYLNTGFSGVSNNVTDFRTGENICGTIYLCFPKIISGPCRYSILSGDKINIDEYVLLNIKYVCTHEIGHQLGERHNFSGNLWPHYNGSIMDYTDVFFNSESLKILTDIEIRKYDLEALRFGYVDNPDNINTIPIPILPVPLITDENILEGINPLGDKETAISDTLKYVSECLLNYRKYRENILKIEDKYVYNTLFLYLYLRKYKSLCEICIKFIGGKIYNINRNGYIDVNKEVSYAFIKMLLKIISEIKYTEEEYKRITYSIKNINSSDLILIDNDSLYNMGNGKLFIYYKEFITNIFKSILELKDKLLYTSGSTGITFLETIDKFLFLIDENNKGIFSYIYEKENIWMIESFIDLLKDNNINKENCNEYNVIKFRIKHIANMILKIKKNINYQVQIFLETLVNKIIS